MTYTHDSAAKMRSASSALKIRKRPTNKLPAPKAGRPSRIISCRLSAPSHSPCSRSRHQAIRHHLWRS
ncbi:Uncharacterised protein [Vibrio cholerae]|nr:Uncharacterised protein [Vibrio cholerae]